MKSVHKVHFVIIIIKLKKQYSFLRKICAGCVMKDGCKITQLPFFTIQNSKLLAKNEAEIISLVQTIRIFSKDIGMQFFLEKGA